MKKILLLLLFLISNFVFSQDTLESIQVVGIRDYKSCPVSLTTIEVDSVRGISNSSSDPFFTINRIVPNSFAQSDNGTQYGYSYLRIRGMDQTRINFTLNGIPMNEMEDQGIYFSNMPGFYNSISRVDITRGVGISKFGSTSVVGSINVETKSLLSKEMIAQFGTGSFGTSSTNLEYSSGLIGKIAFSSSLSYLQTDGFRDHSGSNGHNYFGQFGYFGKNNILKIYGFIGESNNNLSYIPVDKATLSQDYKINFNSLSDIDRFAQNFASINWINSRINHTIFNSSVYFNNVNGHYDVSGYRYGITSYQGGAMSNVTWNDGPWNINIGLNLNLYQREHNLNHLDTLRYSNFGNKNDVVAYNRLSYRLGSYSLFADIQYRGVNFKYQDENGSMMNYKWQFFNPKIGIKKSVKNSESWISVGKTSREVTRSDLFDTNDNVYLDNGLIYSDYLGESNLNSFNIYQIYPNSSPEIVTDLEIGTKFSKSRRNISDFSTSFNLYYMDIRNERLIIGIDRIYGLPIRQIANSSFRSGFEADFSYRYRKFIFGSNGAYLKARTDKKISSFSPEWTMNNFIKYGNSFRIGFNGMYVSSMYLNNGEDIDLSTDPYYIVNFTTEIRFNNVSVNMLVNNLLDQKYLLPGGVLTDNNSRVGQYYPASTRSYFVNLKFNIK